MKGLLALALALSLIGGPVSAAIGSVVKLGSMITTGGSSSVDFTITTVANSPAGALIVCALSWELGSSGAFISTASDSAGNTYTVETFTHSASFNSNIQWIWVANAGALGSGGTINGVVAGGMGFRGMGCYSVTGIATVSPRDFLGSAVSALGTNPSIATGTLAQASEIIFAGTQVFLGTAYAESASFTTLDTLTATNNGLNTASDTVASTSGPTYAPTLTPAAEYAASAISFKGAASAAAGGSLLLLGVGH